MEHALHLTREPAQVWAITYLISLFLTLKSSLQLKHFYLSTCRKRGDTPDFQLQALQVWWVAFLRSCLQQSSSTTSFSTPSQNKQLLRRGHKNTTSPLLFVASSAGCPLRQALLLLRRGSARMRRLHLGSAQFYFSQVSQRPRPLLARWSVQVLHVKTRTCESLWIKKEEICYFTTRMKFFYKTNKKCINQSLLWRFWCGECW